MKKILKRSLCMLLTLCLLAAFLPETAVKANAASAGLSISQLRQKYPHGKYWNHAGNPGSSNAVNNQNGYTDIPCSQHGVVGTSKQTCNGFQPGNTQLSWQCMGYAEKLGYDATGYNPRNNANGWKTYTDPSALNNLKPGDIVRYKNNGHSIYVIAVNGDIVTYTDCNSDGHCKIRWDATISKATLRATFTHVRSGPGVNPEPAPCTCSNVYAGEYVCTTASANLTIRNGHSRTSGKVGSIPSGAVVTVTHASGTGSGDWAHVIYNGVSGYASMEYLKKREPEPEPPVQDRDTRIHLWISDSEMGESIGSVEVNEWIYLCYRLYDIKTGEAFDSYNTDGYSVTLNLYAPNGSVTHTCTYREDNAWIGINRDTPGVYRGELVFRWDDGGVYTSEVSITMKYEPKVTPSVSDVQLNLAGNNSCTIRVSYSGASKSNSIYLNCDREGDSFNYQWGGWEGNSIPLTFTGVRAGSGKVTIRMFDAETNELLATTTVNVKVSAPSYTVTYNANGGTNAPGSQTKQYNEKLTLSSAKPTRTGYTFLGWAESSGAAKAEYLPGAGYTGNKNITLYAVWQKGCTDDSHPFTYKVTAKPTASASGTLTGTCPHCSATEYIALPKLNTSDYSYRVTKAATCSTTGTGTYTLKTTVYGSFSFDVTIAKTEHSYQYAVTAKPTASASGTLTGTCPNCSAAEYIALPKLNTADYTYAVTQEPTYTTAGVGTYTWKNTAYGKFAFTVALDKLVSQLSGLTIKQAPAKVVYTVGEALDTTGMILECKYTDGTTKQISSGFTTSGFSSDVAGPVMVTVSYGGKTAIFQVTIQEKKAPVVTGAVVQVERVTAVGGETVEVKLMVKNSPGISSLRFQVAYGDILTLQEIRFNDALGGQTAKSQSLTSPVMLTWVNVTEERTGDFVFATLVFKVAEGAQDGEMADITVTFQADDIYNLNEDAVSLTVENGSVSVSATLPGDVNGDGKVNNRDATRLLQQLAGWDVLCCVGAVDVNGDGKVNNRDATRLLQYLAGWDVDLE